eukprot:COSAG02_NODE_5405_length_4355_cov_12.651325_2_plen_97_part_00
MVPDAGLVYARKEVELDINATDAFSRIFSSVLMCGRTRFCLWYARTRQAEVDQFCPSMYAIILIHSRRRCTACYENAKSIARLRPCSFSSKSAASW